MAHTKKLAKPSRVCEKFTEVSSPRKRGSKPCEHKLDSRRVESSTHFRGNDKTVGIGFYTVSIPSGKVKKGFKNKVSTPFPEGMALPAAWRETIVQMSLFAIGVPFGYIFHYQFSNPHSQ